MAAFTRTLARVVSNTRPAWRQAMVAEDTLYYVGTNTPESAPQLLGMPTQFGKGGGPPGDGFLGAGWDVISGYASGTMVSDDGGPFGKVVYGCGGHTRVQNQLLGFDINKDNPTFGWWHQPTWSTADVNGANFYWSPTESAALQAGPRGAAAFIDPDNEPATAATWDRQFPVAFGNWIFPRKMTTGQMGNNVTHGVRYKTTGYIPASMTRGDPLYLAVMGAQGPFGLSYKAAGTTDADWFDSSVLVSGARRWPYYFRNARTDTWALHQWQPAGTLRGTSYSGTPVCVFTDIKRAYVLAAVTGSSYWYLDFTLGYVGHTVVNPGAASYPAMSGYCGVAWSEGDRLGRHFAVGLARTMTDETKLVVIDFDAGTSFYVDLAAYGFAAWPEEEFQNMTYDATRGRVLFLRRGSNNRLEYWSITVPAVLTNVAGWVCSAKRTPALADAGMASTHFGGNDRMAHLYGKSDFIPRLGVCLVPFTQQPMLAFVPSA